MRLTKFNYIFGALLIIGMIACKHKPTENTQATKIVFKGLYSFAPGTKTFQTCPNGHELWVADSSEQLELKYSQLVGFEKAGEPVYVELEGTKIKSAKDGDAATYDSTLIVKKLIKITTDIPKGCNL
jgi:copper homeostasis protein (lipoprotein)